MDFQTGRNPDVHQLRTFVAVVEARSFAGAARLLGRTQPAVSQEIARLEDIYGGDLFERRRGVRLELTPVGEAILPSARVILDTIDQQMLRAAAAAQSRSGSLTLGVSPGLMAGPLLGGIAAFTRSSPNVRLHLAEASSGDLYRRLSERTIDLMVVALAPPFDDKTFTKERLWDERLVVALFADHLFAQRDAVGWQDLAAVPIILKDSHSELVLFRNLLDRPGRQADLQQHEVSCKTLLEMIGIGLGATIVFASGASPHPGVVFRPIDEPDAVVGVDAIWPIVDRNPLRHRLLACIRATA